MRCDLAYWPGVIGTEKKTEKKTANAQRATAEKDKAKHGGG